VSVHDKLEKENVANLRFLKELVEARKLKSVIDRTYPLEQLWRLTGTLINGARRVM
jgi:NADPH:quinone reductase-like Zn-dependent oxidoreductase